MAPNIELIRKEKKKKLRMVEKNILEEWMDVHIFHREDTSQRKDVVGYHREA